MEIYLIRHTRTATEPGLCYGQSDVPLASSFDADIESVRLKLPNLAAGCQVISSPLTRCRQLAEGLSADSTVDPRLSELNFGQWEGRRFDEIDNETLSAWTLNFVNQGPPGGESFADLCVRVGAFWCDLLQQGGEQAVIVTHAGAIRALLAHVLALPPANAFQLRIDPGSVHKLRHQQSYTYIDYLNR